jgi:hypothetical protein
VSIDLGALWNALNGIIGQITSFFGGIGNSLQGITNAGQGIFSGLASYGSAIWQGIVSFGQSIVSAFETIGNLLSGAWNTFSNAVQTAWSLLSQAFFSGITTLGNWIWSAVSIMGELGSSLLNAILGTLTEAVTAFWGLLQAGFSSVATAANSFFSGLVTSWRQKMKTTIIADMTLYFGWHGASTAIKGLASFGESEHPIRSLGSKLLMLVGAPIAGAVAGMVLAELLDALLPSTDLNVQIFPTFTIPDVALSTHTVPIPSGRQTPGGISPPQTPSSFLHTATEAITKTAADTTSGHDAVETVKSGADANNENVGVESVQATTP